MKHLLTIGAVALLALNVSGAAFAADTSYNAETKVERKDDGGYKAETTTKAEDSAGTTTETKKKAELDVDSKGNTEKTESTESTSDPKGLFNKKKSSVKDSVKHKNGKTVVKHTKKIDGDTVEDSETTTDHTTH